MGYAPSVPYLDAQALHSGGIDCSTVFRSGKKSSSTHHPDLHAGGQADGLPANDTPGQKRFHHGIVLAPPRFPDWRRDDQHPAWRNHVGAYLTGELRNSALSKRSPREFPVLACFTPVPGRRLELLSDLPFSKHD